MAEQLPNGRGANTGGAECTVRIGEKSRTGVIVAWLGRGKVEIQPTHGHRVVGILLP